MSFRTRLLVVSLTTLAVGLGALVVVGNVVFGARVHAETTNLLDARADAQLAALNVSGGRVTVNESPNDPVLDRQAWVLAGDTVVERPAGVAPALDRAAVALARSGGSGERDDGPDDMHSRARPVLDGGAHFRFGLNAVRAFWLAYILTRPLGASIGDGCRSRPTTAGSASAPRTRATSSSGASSRWWRT